MFFEGPYRFFFWAYDCAERKHIHVERDEVIAKFWVDPDFSLEDGGGFSRKDLRDIQRVIERRKEEVENGWGRFCK